MRADAGFVGWWYLSFVGESGWLGGCFVRAAGYEEAVAKSHDAGCNPGGEVSGWGPLAVEIKPGYGDRLLTLEESQTARLEL